MPTLTARKPDEVPSNSRVSKVTRDRQLVYDGFVKGIVDDVGELKLDPEERIRSVKVSLRRAANRLGVGIEVWDANGSVYFRREIRRGRPRRAK
jgi:hypothetical protein